MSDNETAEHLKKAYRALMDAGNSTEDKMIHVITAKALDHVRVALEWEGVKEEDLEE